MWNNLDENIKSCDDINSFMRALRDHIINSNKANTISIVFNIADQKV